MNDPCISKTCYDAQPKITKHKFCKYSNSEFLKFGETENVKTYRNNDVTIQAPIQVFQVTLHPDQTVLLAVIKPVARSACSNDSLLTMKFKQFELRVTVC